MDTQSFLHRLPEHLLVAALHKMTNVQICRMRQTCSYVDTVVEANRRKLANRPGMGCSVALNCCAFEGIPELPEEFKAKLTFNILTDTGGMQTRLLFRDSMEVDFEKKMSAIAIAKLQIAFNGYAVPEAEEQLFNALRRCRLSCDWLQVFGIPTPLLIEVVDYIDCRGKTSLQMQHGEFNDANFGTLVAALKEKPKSNTFKVTVNSLPDCTIEGLFNLVKPFRAVSAMECTTESFHKLLKEVANSSGVGNLEKITCQFWIQRLEHEEFMPFDGPDVVPSTKIWDTFDLPHELHEVVVQTDEGVLMDWKTPSSVRLLTLPENYVVIVTFEDGAIWHEELHFVPKDDNSVLQILIHELRLGYVSSDFQEAYLAAPSDIRQEMLIEEFKITAVVGAFRKDGFF